MSFVRLFIPVLLVTAKTFGFSPLHSSRVLRRFPQLPPTGKTSNHDSIASDYRLRQQRQQRFLAQPDSAAQDSSMSDEQEATAGEHTFTAALPTLRDLENLNRGDFAASDPFTIQEKYHEYKFRVLFYPRGGGHSSSYTAMNSRRQQQKQQQSPKQEGGFGMAYEMVPLIQGNDPKNDRVGIYLQYLPEKDEDTVDATYCLRVKGKQSSGPKFDVEWSAGMRFVGPELGKLRDGTANDFGAHMMQSPLLPQFLGEDNDAKLEVAVRVKIHEPETSKQTSKEDKGMFSFDDIRKTDNSKEHDNDAMRVGKIVVPMLRGLSQRPRMFEIGAHPGVEYRVLRIFHPDTGEEIFTSMPGADYELKPIYPLVAQLEREWPVRVNEKELPKLVNATMYNVIYALGSLFTAVTGLTTAFIISQLVSIFFIPSKSMDPTLQVGDVLLVDKVTPRLLKKRDVGDVVLFHPNTRLQDIVKSSGGKISDRDLFVKRVAAGPGDSVTVDSSGKVYINSNPIDGRRDLCEEEPLKLIERFIQPMNAQTIPKDDVFVLGDCSSVSVDSRVWGPLETNDIVGRPIMRIWPLNRMGAIPPLPTSVEEPLEKSSLVIEWSD